MMSCKQQNKMLACGTAQECDVVQITVGRALRVFLLDKVGIVTTSRYKVVHKFNWFLLNAGICRVLCEPQIDFIFTKDTFTTLNFILRHDVVAQKSQRLFVAAAYSINQHLPTI